MLWKLLLLLLGGGSLGRGQLSHLLLQRLVLFVVEGEVHFQVVHELRDLERFGTLLSFQGQNRVQRRFVSDVMVPQSLVVPVL